MEKIEFVDVTLRDGQQSLWAELPYVVAIVEFEEGGRLMSNLTGCPPDTVRIGMPVRTVFETVAEGIGVPKFRPLE